MSIRDAARIAALETCVSELTARVERLEQAAAFAREDEREKVKSQAVPRRWRN
jgi:outer membrane murein-binding lipoprotein Lpp